MLEVFLMLCSGILTACAHSGLPFSKYFSYIAPWNRCPNRAVVLNLCIVTCLSLINIGSTTAFNSLLSLTTIAIYISYGIPIFLIFLRRFSSTNPIIFGPWNLGAHGLWINGIAVLFCIFLVIFLPFPPILPVTAQNMNYASVMLVGVMALAMLQYFVFGGRKKFVGPIREVQLESEPVDEQQAELIRQRLMRLPSRRNLMDSMVRLYPEILEDKK